MSASTNQAINYGEAILEGFRYLLKNKPEVFVVGQGLWSPWYVGNSMRDLDKDFGRDRVMDSPVSEDATTGIAVGASLCGYRPIVVHPRVDFMILATNPIVNQAAKWSHMLGGQAHPSVVFRGIVNRGGEQGAQHSQALHSWYAHIPGLRVVMPATVQDARDLLIAATLCDDPVMYIDDRWLYDQTDTLPEPKDLDIRKLQPQILKAGNDISLVGAGHATLLNLQAAEILAKHGISAEVVDLRIINPIEYGPVIASVKKTGHMLAVDGGWTNCGLAGELIAGVVERLPMSAFKRLPRRLTLTDAPAPTSKPLEAEYYVTAEDVAESATQILKN